MTTPRPPYTTPTDADSTIDRRKFITVAGLGAGLLLTGCTSEDDAVPGLVQRRRLPLIGRSSARIVVVGAGAFGGWTAYHLRKAGATVTMVDIWGPGNSRSTSGDETRGVRSSYGNRGESGELWMLWARESMSRWKKWDEEWSKEMKVNLYHTTGDVILRSDWDNLTTPTKALWEKHKIPHEVLKPEEVKKRWPVYSTDDITVVMTEPDAGVVRARRATQTVAAAFEKIGGTIKIGRATITKTANGKVEEVTLDTGEKLTADVFVFACGPWMAKVFPEVMKEKMRLPMGYVSYFATPPGDQRFVHPNLPSFNYPGVTGWAALPVDSRGFRVRGGSRNPNTAGPGVQGAAAAPGARGGAAPQSATPAGTARSGGAAAAPAGRGGRRGGTARGGRGQGTTGRGTARGGVVPAAAGGGQGGAPANAQAQANPNQSDPDLSDRWTDPARLEGPRNFLALRIPLLKDMPINETRACHYESTSSDNFLVDKHPQLSNVWLAGGGNAEGFKFGPVIGDYIAQRVLGDDGDPVVAKNFVIPAKTYEQLQAERAAAAPPPPPADTGRGRGR